MKEIVLANAGIYVNGILVGRVPNSLKIKLGLGKNVANTEIFDSNNISVFWSTDLTTKMSMIDFSSYIKKENIANLVDWFEKSGDLEIQLIEGRNQIIFQNCGIEEEPELVGDENSKMEFKFKGAPAKVILA